MSEALGSPPAVRPTHGSDGVGGVAAGPASVSTVRFILRLLRNQRGRYTASALLWITIWTLPTLFGLITAAFFDAMTGQAPGWNVTTVAVALAAWTVAYVATIIMGMRTHGALLFKAGAGMQQSMLRRIFALPGAQPVHESTGEVVSRFRDDVDHTLEAMDFSVDLLGSIVSAIVAVTILMFIDPVITATVFIPVGIVVVIAARMGTRIRRYRIAARETTEAITGFLGEAFGAIQSVKVAGAERAMLARFDDLNEQRRVMMVRDRTFVAVLQAVFQNTVSIGTGVILVLAAGSLATSAGQAGLTIGQFALFVYMLVMVTDSAYFIGLFLARVKQAGVSIERMMGMMQGASWEDLATVADLGLADRPAGAPATNGGPLTPGTDLLSVRGLTFRHPTSGLGITDVDVDIRVGELVVVTGRIGAGKTTLLRTIMGLLPAQAGEIRWRGQVVDDPAAFMVPPQVAYTPQVPRLFSLSLQENLLLGQDVDPDDLAEALAIATLERDVAAMPDGLATMIGPRGVRLSGGQIQRSAAARMLVRRPHLLVFDDLSSALDVETEAALWERLFARPDTTALVVSHRRPALMRADQVIVMEDGQVVDRGTADELLSRSPAFRDLWG
jgi:ATP-binding cassette, subfamily B, bacterial